MLSLQGRVVIAAEGEVRVVGIGLVRENAPVVAQTGEIEQGPAGLSWNVGAEDPGMGFREQ
ncbi:hypothetical protein AC1659_30490 [Rhodococcus erythropolis]|uniref:hypothetical protein n=1 Tax=Rhodococcus erythropolis TaxID=1833 RepID=UPI001BAB79BB|nr:hypothetical protein [Rhodococcus erythropolis]MBS2993612.1 hypothetical protein [Rhodococcus erythropolis]